MTTKTTFSRMIEALILLALCSVLWACTCAGAQTNENEEGDSSVNTEVSERFAGALENGEIEVWLQPIAAADTLEICGSEALSRWKMDGEYIPPSVFVPILEQTGQVSLLDEYVFKTACEIQETRIREGKTLFPISVNLSGASLQDEDLVQKYESICKAHQVPEKYINVEVTETFDAGADRVEEVARAFRACGFMIEMDDFGAGFATIANLARIDYNVLKIDKGLVDMIGTGRGEVVLKAVIALGEKLGMTVIAEGVETENQVQFLRENGCHCIQGYFFSRPLPIEEWEAFVSGQAK